MRVFGADFTSAPWRGKPITLARCSLERDRLVCDGFDRIETLDGFEAALVAPGPWVMGADFPFAFARGLPTALGWPEGDWRAFAAHLAAMDRVTFETALTDHRNDQPAGRKYLFRQLDRRTGGAAPNNIVNPPVGKMPFEGVRRLYAAGVCLPGLAPGDPDRRVVEAYPAISVHALIGPGRYKDGRPATRTEEAARRRDLLAALAGDPGGLRFGFVTQAPSDFADDDISGDLIDALVCAVQAAWAHRAGFTEREGPGARGAAFDPAEGWIADPEAFHPPFASST